MHSEEFGWESCQYSSLLLPVQMILKHLSPSLVSDSFLFYYNFFFLQNLVQLLFFYFVLFSYFTFSFTPIALDIVDTSSRLPFLHPSTAFKTKRKIYRKKRVKKRKEKRGKFFLSLSPICFFFFFMLNELPLSFTIVQIFWCHVIMHVTY